MYSTYTQFFSLLNGVWFMRIDGLKDNTINVEAAYNVGFQNREASGIAEIFSQDAGVMTMNSTN